LLRRKKVVSFNKFYELIIGNFSRSFESDNIFAIGLKFDSSLEEPFFLRGDIIEFFQLEGKVDSEKD